MTIVRESISAEASISLGTLQIAIPAGVANDDVLVALLGGNHTAAQITGAPSGWTKAIGVDISGAAPCYSIYYKLITNAAGEPSTYSWTFSGGSGRGIIARYSGVDTGTQEDVAAGSGTASNKTAVTAPAITTATANAQVISGAAQTINTNVTAPASLSQFFGPANTGAGGGDLNQAAAGSTGTFVWTLGSKDNGIAVTWALRPATTAVTFQPRPTGNLFQDPAVFMGGLRQVWHRHRSGISVPEYSF